MPYTRHILFIDPYPFHTELVRDILPNFPVKTVIKKVSDFEQAKQILKNKSFDLVITEFPDSPSDENVLNQIMDLCNDTPVIVLTVQNEHHQAVHAMKLGAADYIIKNRDSLVSLHEIMVKTLQKKGHSRPSRRKKTRMDSLRENLKSLADLMDRPTQSLAWGKNQLKKLEQEIENIKEMIRKRMG